MSTLSDTDGGKVVLGSAPVHHKRTAFNTYLAFWLLVLPALLLFAVMMLWPLVNMFYVSTLDWRGLIKPSSFDGVGNYYRLFTRPQFYTALQNTSIHILVALPGTIIPAFILGFFLSLRRPGYRIFRTIYFTPVMFAVPALTLLFLGLYLPDGIINFFLRAMGLESLTRVWLANPSTSLGAIIAIDLWAGIGFYSVLFFTRLSIVSPDLYEAAKLDGAGYWNIMWKIAFPLTLDFFGIAMMLHLMHLLLGSAQNVLLLTKGGPGTSSLTLGYYLFQQAFEVKLLGYSQAIGVIIFTFGLLGMLIIRQITRRDYEF